MNRPTGMAERRSAAEARRVAAVRAALAARRAEQAAAARRRLVITLVLGVVTVVSWVAVAVADFQIGFAVFTTAVLVGILWLGTRAARAERAEWDEVPEHLREPRVATPAGPTYSAAQLREHLATGEGSAASSASAVASVMSDGAAPVAPAGSLAGNGGNLRWSTDAAGADDTPIEAGSGDATPVAGGVGGARAAAPGTWTPVPVPVPTYTLKATALRREVDAPEVTVGAEGAAPSGLSSGEGDWTEQRDERAERVEPGIDLDAVLARRRGA